MTRILTVGEMIFNLCSKRGFSVLISDVDTSRSVWENLCPHASRIPIRRAEQTSSSERWKEHFPVLLQLFYVCFSVAVGIAWWCVADQNSKINTSSRLRSALVDWSKVVLLWVL